MQDYEQTIAASKQRIEYLEDKKKNRFVSIDLVALNTEIKEEKSQIRAYCQALKDFKLYC